MHVNHIIPFGSSGFCSGFVKQLKNHTEISFCLLPEPAAAVRSRKESSVVEIVQSRSHPEAEPDSSGVGVRRGRLVSGLDMESARMLSQSVAIVSRHYS